MAGASGASPRERRNNGGLLIVLTGILLGSILGALLVILATAPMIAMLGSP